MNVNERGFIPVDKLEQEGYDTYIYSVDAFSTGGYLPDPVYSSFLNRSDGSIVETVIHELAHIRRHDVLVNYVQAVAETLLFYHPAVWWISRRIREERELCCDDAAVAVTGDRLGLARALLRLEELRRPVPRLAQAAAGGSLPHRIARLLGGGTMSRQPTPNPLVGTVLMVSIVALGGVAWTAATGSVAPGSVVSACIADAEPTVFFAPEGHLDGAAIVGGDDHVAVVCAAQAKEAGRNGIDVKITFDQQVEDRAATVDQDGVRALADFSFDELTDTEVENVLQEDPPSTAAPTPQVDFWKNTKAEADPWIIHVRGNLDISGDVTLYGIIFSFGVIPVTLMIL